MTGINFLVTILKNCVHLVMTNENANVLWSRANYNNYHIFAFPVLTVLCINEFDRSIRMPHFFTMASGGMPIYGPTCSGYGSP
ncbi:hypothetical protein CW304_02460 [Bacillus sp. UFRGS-B20]|nr:hypothetical protein CW304_02460 [Bacillus sp. UFRGS-B20]